jgi:DNA polymerase III subunit beta
MSDIQFFIQRETLLKPLQSVANIVDRKPHNLSIVANILFSVQPNRLVLTATDLEVEIQASEALPDEAVKSAGEFTLPARKLLDICRSLPTDAMISFDVDHDKKRCTVRSEKSKFILSCLSVTDFPVFSHTESIAMEIDRHHLRELFEQTVFAMAQQDVRYYLTGLLMEFERHKVSAVATDGHRLSFAGISVLNNAFDDKIQLIFPRKAVQELMRLLQDQSSDEDLLKLNIADDQRTLLFTFDNIRFAAQLLDGQYPDYHKVIPKQGAYKIQADRLTLRDLLFRTAILSNEKYRGIRLHFEQGRLLASANNPEKDEAEEDMEVVYSNEAIAIGFNVTYLLDAINAIKDDDVQLEFQNADSSCIVRSTNPDTDSLHVVMPLKL